MAENLAAYLDVTWVVEMGERMAELTGGGQAALTGTVLESMTGRLMVDWRAYEKVS